MRMLQLRRRDFENALYGAADYLSQPLGYLLFAPVLLHKLGPAQFGMWVLATAAVGSGALLSTGFGDAAVRYVSAFRGEGNLAGAAGIVRSMLAINLLLGLLGAGLLLSVAPFAVRHVAALDAQLQHSSVAALRFGALLLIIRSLESVFIASSRAFERYGPTVRIATLVRLAALTVSAAVAIMGRGIVEIMAATLAVAMCGVFLQAHALGRCFGYIPWQPEWRPAAIRKIAGFGCFSWLQSLTGIFSTQADRFVIGAFLGAAPVAYYSICIQAAQPIQGIVSSGLHFLFPHLSARSARESRCNLRRTVLAAFALNATFVVLLTLPYFFFARSALALWAGAPVAAAGADILPLVAAGFALTAVNVTAYYALLAAGRVRLVTLLNMVAGAVSLAAMLLLVPHLGVRGAALARLLYGPITWVTYAAVFHMMRMPQPQLSPAQSLLRPVTEG